MHIHSKYCKILNGNSLYNDPFRVENYMCYGDLENLNYGDLENLNVWLLKAE